MKTQNIILAMSHCTRYRRCLCFALLFVLGAAATAAQSMVAIVYVNSRTADNEQHIKDVRLMVDRLNQGALASGSNYQYEMRNVHYFSSVENLNKDEKYVQVHVVAHGVYYNNAYTGLVRDMEPEDKEASDIDKLCTKLHNCKEQKINPNEVGVNISIYNFHDYGGGSAGYQGGGGRIDSWNGIAASSLTGGNWISVTYYYETWDGTTLTSRSVTVYIWKPDPAQQYWMAT